MGKKYKNLFDKITSTDNLYDAYKKASKGKRYSLGHLVFKNNLHANINLLSNSLSDQTYTPSSSKTFFVYEPKKREISALPFSDRVVQHALCNIIEPIFDATFLPGNYACRKDKGTHKAVVKCQSIMRRGTLYWYKIDFSKYFASIDRTLLYKEIERKISCRKTLDLIQLFLPRIGNGLPIGNLTSQLFANVYGHILDRFLVHVLKIHNWLRYMDDTIIFHHDKDQLTKIQNEITIFTKNTLSLTFSKWSMGSVTDGIEWLGYKIWPTHKLLKKQSVIAAKRKIAKYKLVENKTLLTKFIASWSGHARWANSYNLLNKLGVSQ